MTSYGRTLVDESDLDRLRFSPVVPRAADLDPPSETGAGPDQEGARAGEGAHAPPLLPVVVQDADVGTVLMVAYSDRRALVETLRTRQMHFWSRSRRELWRKGETSGNTLALVSLHDDCDGDAVLARVRPSGPACHTGDPTCFGLLTDVDETATEDHVLDRLDATLASRASRRPADSYTVRLLDDENLRLKKLGEEGAELVAALASGDAPRATEEAADLLYHILVALRAMGVGAADLLEVLETRAG